MGQVKIPNNTSTNFVGNHMLSGATPGGIEAPSNYSFFSTAYSIISLLTNPAPNGFHIYQGALPTQAQLDAMSNAAVYTNLNTLPRYNDMLFYAKPTSSSMVNASWQISIPPATALKTGTASWFMLFAQYAGQLGNNAVVGSLSAIGGAGDIEITTLNFNAGSMYKLPQISIPFPTKFSW